MTETLYKPPLESTIEPLEDSAAYSDHIDGIIAKQKQFYNSGQTKPYEFRLKQLKKLKKLIEENEELLTQAFQADLHRPSFETSYSIGIVLNDIKLYLEKVLTTKPPFVTTRLKKWMSPKKHRSTLFFIGSKAYTQRVPKGVVLIISPWNYPILLTFTPLVGAIAAGNTAVIKPSEYSPHSSNLIAKLINQNFDSNYVHAETGGVDKAKIIVDKKEWDHIFYTGSTETGRKVYQTAAKHLIPVTLELGGKSPAIIDKDAPLKLSAKRIVHTKFVNSGQTCVAPDYLLVHNEVKDKLIELMKHFLVKFYSDDPLKNKDYSRIITKARYNNLEPLIHAGGDVVVGGDHVAEDLYIAPTVIDGITPDSKIMEEEIFGPLLPIITWDEVTEVIDYVKSRPHPLALYVYTTNKKLKNTILNSTEFGGCMINDSILHYSHPHAPFGGIGDSGIGSYTGKATFDELTQNRPVIESGRLLDRLTESLGIKYFRYPPYNPTKKKLLKLVQRTFSRIRL